MSKEMINVLVQEAIEKKTKAEKGMAEAKTSFRKIKQMILEGTHLNDKMLELIIRHTQDGSFPDMELYTLLGQMQLEIAKNQNALMLLIFPGFRITFTTDIENTKVKDGINNASYSLARIQGFEISIHASEKTCIFPNGGKHSHHTAHVNNSKRKADYLIHSDTFLRLSNNHDKTGKPSNLPDLIIGQENIIERIGKDTFDKLYSLLEQ